MRSLIGKQAPKFDATAVINGHEIVQNFSLDQYKGKKYVVFFFYPMDFTFVCPTELHAFQEKLEEFEKRDVAVVGCSVDSEYSHFSWLQMPKNEGGIQGVKYPIVSDFSKSISESYGVLAGSYAPDENGNWEPAPARTTILRFFAAPMTSAVTLSLRTMSASTSATAASNWALSVYFSSRASS